MKSINIGSNLFANRPTANIDAKYGVYESREEAYEALGEDGADVIALGLTVGIKTDNGVEEYWWRNGLSFEDLVPKTIDVSSIMSALVELKKALEENTALTNSILDRLKVQEEAQEDDEWEEI